jgi:hypothetical protein
LKFQFYKPAEKKKQNDAAETKHLKDRELCGHQKKKTRVHILKNKNTLLQETCKGRISVFG